MKSSVIKLNTLPNKLFGLKLPDMCTKLTTPQLCSTQMKLFFHTQSDSNNFWCCCSDLWLLICSKCRLFIFMLNFFIFMLFIFIFMLIFLYLCFLLFIFILNVFIFMLFYIRIHVKFFIFMLFYIHIHVIFFILCFVVFISMLYFSYLCFL